MACSDGGEGGAVAGQHAGRLPRRAARGDVFLAGDGFLAWAARGGWLSPVVRAGCPDGVEGDLDQREQGGGWVRPCGGEEGD